MPVLCLELDLSLSVRRWLIIVIALSGFIRHGAPRRVRLASRGLRGLQGDEIALKRGDLVIDLRPCYPQLSETLQQGMLLRLLNLLNLAHSLVFFAEERGRGKEVGDR